MIRHLLLTLLALASLHAEGPQLPPEAVALLPEALIAPKVMKAEFGTIEKVESTDAPTNPIFRATSPAKLEKSYELALNKSFTGAIAKDQVCLFVVKARTVESEMADGKGKITCAVQNTKDYKSTVLWKTQIIGKDWETTYFVFQAGNDLPEGVGNAKIAIGEQKQVIEVADIQVYRFPIGFDVFKAPQMKKTYAGRELDAPWRAEAEARIAKLRQGQLNVVVHDAAGKPIEGAKVTVRMKRHLFGFGSAVDVNMLSGLGFKISEQDQIKYRNTVDELFSRVVPESGLRVGNIEGATDPTKPWEAANRLRTQAAVQWTLQWAKDKKMTSRGHYLSWGYLEPWAAEEVKKGGPAGLMARYDQHWAFALPFAAPYVDEWDALNHPVPFVEADALYNVVGPDVYPDIYAKIRKQTDKLLFVNEDTFNPDRTSGFDKHMKHLIAKGQTPDGCGFQSHFSDYAIPSIDDEWKIYQHFGSMVKHLTVTEYDFQTLDDQLHADHMRDMLTLCYSHPQMTGFVIWGFWEKRHWKPTAAMFKADWTERPAVQVWRDLVKGKWWTRADLAADAKGEATTTAYYGWFDITIEHAGKMKAFEVKHATNGGKPTLKLE
jgi:GH35 family endo-1,4-beta-xylanase